LLKFIPKIFVRFEVFTAVGVKKHSLLYQGRKIDLGVFENKLLWGKFEPKRDEVTGEWRNPHNDKFYKLYPSSRIIRTIKRRMMRGRDNRAYGFLKAKPQ
jgi:hypothetical protein